MSQSQVHCTLEGCGKAKSTPDMKRSLYLFPWHRKPVIPGGKPRLEERSIPEKEKEMSSSIITFTNQSLTSCSADVSCHRVRVNKELTGILTPTPRYIKTEFFWCWVGRGLFQLFFLQPFFHPLRPILKQIRRNFSSLLPVSRLFLSV